MLLSLNLSALSMQQLVQGTRHAVGYQIGAGAVEGVVSFLSQRFIDQSQRVTNALKKANGHAWRALEIALAGPGFWDRCKSLLSSADEKAFRDQLRPFLNACPLAELQGRDRYRADCLKELHTASKAGLLTEGNLDPTVLAKKVGAFAQFSKPLEIIEAENEALAQMAEELTQAGYPNLASLVGLRPQGGAPLLVIAARYFFRRRVEEDAELFRELAFAQLETIKHDLDASFGSLHSLLEERLERIDQVLDNLQATVTATHDAVLDVREEQQRQGMQADLIYQKVVDLQSRLDLMHTELRPRDSLSIRNEQERRLVRDLVGQYRQLPEEKRQQLPALLNAIGKLEVAAGDFDEARADFVTVASLVGNAEARAEAHYNAFRAALEQRNWDVALHEMQQATSLSAERFSPFPMDKLIPQRILGAGGFGVAYLCRHRYMKTDVVVKSLFDEELTCAVDDLFSEAQVLRQLDHPAIVRIQDCGFASSEERRPYLVMDYFAGQTLEAQAREKPLSVEEMLQVASLIASGLEAAHARKILHRDVKPANLLIRKLDHGWDVRLIDFGLALNRSRHDTLRATSATIMGSSIAGTLDYAAPEQMGKLPGVAVSAASDIYGFARTCCYALFQTPQPLPRHWRSIPDGLADLLELCLEHHPENRPSGFSQVREAIQKLSGAPKKLSVTLDVIEPSPEPIEEKVVTTTATNDDVEERKRALDQLAAEVAGCTKCSQLAKARTNTVFGTGPLDPDICFIGEAPGADEDRQGIPFIGAGGQMLDRIISAMGIKRAEVYITNILRCRPPGNRDPLPTEVENCRGYLKRQLDLVRPKIIVALGRCASQSLLGVTSSLGRMRHQLHHYDGIPVVCTYHPASLLPSRSPENKRDVWADMQLVLKQLGKGAET